MRFSLFAILLAASLPAVAFAQPQPGQPAPIEVRIDSAKVVSNKNQTSIAVSGGARVPDETVVRITVRLAGPTGRVEVAPVVKGAFQANFDFGKAKLLPGTYHIEADVVRDEQLPHVQESLKNAELMRGQFDLISGTPEEFQQESARLRDAYRGLLSQLRMLFLNLSMWGSFTNAKAMKVRVEGLGEVDERQARVVWDDWSGFTADTWSRMFPVARHDFLALTKYVELTYYPDTEASIRGIIDDLEALHAWYTLAISRNIGRDVPKEVEERAGPVNRDLPDTIRTLAIRAYEELGVKPFVWRTIDLATPEIPTDIDGNKFKSTVSKFEIEKPKDWMFDFLKVNPNVRIRMMPTDEKLLTEVVGGVEIHDFPAAESFEDLARQLEATTRNASPTFEEVKIEDLKIPDETMPNGERPGLLMIYKVTEGKFTYQVRQYALFCRWHKRVYLFLGLCPAESYVKWEPTLDSTSGTFKVLDDPKLFEHGPDWVEEDQGEGTGEGEGGGSSGGEAK